VVLVVLYGVISLGTVFFRSPRPVKIVGNNNNNNNNDHSIARLPSAPSPTHEPRCPYVNPFIGTGGHGHTFPGATVPFGMVQVSPSSGNKQWDWCSGYHYSDTKVISFGHLHLSGTGIGDGFDVSLFPAVRDGEALQGDFYTHTDEVASPGYYAVRLKSDIFVELTATNRTAMHRYTFPANSASVVHLHLGYGFDNVMDTVLEVHNSTRVTGYRRSGGWARSHEVHFALDFSCPYTGVNPKCGGAPWQQQGNMRISCGSAEARFMFAESCKVLMIRVGLSSASVEGAIKSLQHEAPDFDFDRVRAEAAQEWEKELSMVELEGDKEALW